MCFEQHYETRWIYSLRRSRSWFFIQGHHKLRSVGNIPLKDSFLNVLGNMNCEKFVKHCGRIHVHSIHLISTAFPWSSNQGRLVLIDFLWWKKPLTFCVTSSFCASQVSGLSGFLFYGAQGDSGVYGTTSQADFRNLKVNYEQLRWFLSVSTSYIILSEGRNLDRAYLKVRLTKSKSKLCVHFWNSIFKDTSLLVSKIFETAVSWKLIIYFLTFYKSAALPCSITNAFGKEKIPLGAKGFLLVLNRSCLTRTSSC